MSAPESAERQDKDIASLFKLDKPKDGTEGNTLVHAFHDGEPVE